MTKMQQAFNNAMNCGDFYTASELAETMRNCKEESQKENDLIPATPELNRLKEFLASTARPYTEEELMNAKLDYYANWGAREKCIKCGDPLFGSEIAICDYCLKVYQIGP